MGFGLGLAIAKSAVTEHGGRVEVGSSPSGGARFTLVLRFASDLDDETVRKLEVIAAKCPVHRTLEGEVMFEDSVKLVQPVTT